MVQIPVGSGILILDQYGNIADIVLNDGQSVYPQKILAPFIQAGCEEKLYSPVSMISDKQSLTFAFSQNWTIILNYMVKDGYTVFTATHVPKEIDHIVFGPIPCTIKQTIGEVVGVVRDDNYAVGIQALNIKTLPGFPPYKAEAFKQFGSDKNMSEISVETVDYFKSAAFETNFGSVLQLFCENRRKERLKTVQNIPNVPVAAYDDPDADIEGAKFALFCRKSSDALSAIGEIESGEGLPHPMIDGEWGKTARSAMRSYFITEFGTDNINKILDYAVKGGFREVYHSEPFKTWGHFLLRDDYFPKGDLSLAECSAKAKERGIGLGLHTLSNFTTTNDPYVTPVPHEHLMKTGCEILVNSINEDDTELAVSDAGLFGHHSFLQTVQIDDELIQFAYIQEDKPVLKDCVRGAFGTIKSEHKQGSKVYMLFDHGYKVFFPDIRLQDAFSDRLVDLFNYADLVQISFDGLEGCRYNGEDEYAVNRFCMRCYDGWNNEVINDASQLNHNLWHMNTRMNWGEPWGAKMREGMIEARLKNQEFYRKNLFPRMLGWFLIRLADRKFEATTLDDIEWALSEAAGLDAGFAFVAMEKTLEGLGNIDEILETVKVWEELRVGGLFPQELREQLWQPFTDWHLTRSQDAGYLLYPMDISQKFTCDLAELQPGQKGGADWTYCNKFHEQEYEYRIRVVGDGYVENLFFTTGKGTLKIPCRVKGGQYLISKGNGKVAVTDKNYNIISEFETSGNAILSKGNQSLSFYCDFGGEEYPEVIVTIITKGQPIEIK